MGRVLGAIGAKDFNAMKEVVGILFSWRSKYVKNEGKAAPEDVDTEIQEYGEEIEFVTSNELVLSKFEALEEEVEDQESEKKTPSIQESPKEEVAAVEKNYWEEARKQPMTKNWLLKQCEMFLSQRTSNLSSSELVSSILSVLKSKQSGKLLFFFGHFILLT